MDILDIILTTLVNQYVLDEEFYSKLATASKLACSIGGYTVHNHQFYMGIPTGKIKLNKLMPCRLNDGHERIQNLIIIFIDEYSMLQQDFLCIRKIKAN